MRHTRHAGIGIVVVEQMTLLSRRTVLTGLLAAPLVVRAGLLMPVSSRASGTDLSEITLAAAVADMRITETWTREIGSGLWICKTESGGKVLNLRTVPYLPFATYSRPLDNALTVIHRLPADGLVGFA